MLGTGLNTIINEGNIDLDSHLLDSQISGPGSGTRSGTRYLTVQQVTVQVYISLIDNCIQTRSQHGTDRQHALIQHSTDRP